jgi:cystathionine beta-lyase
MTDLTTRLIHHPYQPPEGFDAVMPPVHKASTVIFPNVAALRQRQWRDKTGYTYGLHGTPTTFILEERIATLEGGLQTLLVPSGLAAISLVNMALLRSGDEVLIPDNAYGPNKELARHELARWGITHRLYDPLDLRGLEGLITPATRLIWIEAAGSVTMEFPDVPALLALARERGLTTALDNTWGAGLAFNPFDVLGDGASGVDISVQALTKFPSGGGDILMGSVTTREFSLHHTLKLSHMRMGWGVGANDVELVLRSLPSMALRYDAQDASARALASWWAAQPEVVQLLHPAFDSCPGHANWQALCTRAAGLFSVVLDARIEQVKMDAFLDGLKLFKLGYSWAGPVSLVVPYDLVTLRQRPSWSGTVMRFALGLESAEDLIADCAQALPLLRA